MNWSVSATARGLSSRARPRRSIKSSCSSSVAPQPLSRAGDRRPARRFSLRSSAATTSTKSSTTCRYARSTSSSWNEASWIARSSARGAVDLRDLLKPVRNAVSGSPERSSHGLIACIISASMSCRSRRISTLRSRNSCRTRTASCPWRPSPVTVRSRKSLFCRNASVAARISRSASAGFLRILLRAAAPDTDAAMTAGYVGLRRPLPAPPRRRDHIALTRGRQRRLWSSQASRFSRPDHSPPPTPQTGLGRHGEIHTRLRMDPPLVAATRGSGGAPTGDER